MYKSVESMIETKIYNPKPLVLVRKQHTSPAAIASCIIQKQQQYLVVRILTKKQSFYIIQYYLLAYYSLNSLHQYCIDQQNIMGNVALKDCCDNQQPAKMEILQNLQDMQVVRSIRSNSNPEIKDNNAKERRVTQQNYEKNELSEGLMPSQMVIDLELVHEDYVFMWKGRNKKEVNGFVKVYTKNKKQLIFEGEYLKGLRNGYGMEYDNGQLFYQGQFKNDLRDGWGKLKIQDESYEGEFRKGLYDGFGQHKMKGEIYQGQFKQGKNYGLGLKITGKQLNLPKEIKLGQFFFLLLDGGMTNTDLSKYHIQEIYVGEWWNGMKNGNGKLWRLNGYWYNGQFSQSLYHGIGALYEPQQNLKSTAVINGTFKNGKIAKK